MSEVQSQETEDANGQNESGTHLIGQVILIIFGIVAAVILILAGSKMLGIQSQASQSGTITITEVYYHAMGLGFIGLGVLGGGLSIGLSLKK